MRTLIYEPGHRGHRKEWILLLWNYCEMMGSVGNDPRFDFLVHRDIAEAVMAARNLKEPPDRLHVIPDQVMKGFVTCKNSWGRGQAEALFLNRFLRERTFDRLLLLYLNVLQLHLRGLRGIKCIEGVMFNHLPVRFRSMSGVDYIFSAITRFRKMLQYAYLTRTPSIGRIFILEDQDAVAAHNRAALLKPVFTVLRDPVNENVLTLLTKAAGQPVEAEDKPRLRILAVGTIEPRKGVDLLLNGVIELCSRKLEYDVQITIIGRFADRKTEHQVKELCKTVVEVAVQADNRVELNCFHEHAAESLLAEELSMCSVVHLGYRGVTGSSGVLGLAAAARKPVVACQEGLIGRTVASLGLGLVVKVSNANAFANALDQVAKGQFAYNYRAAGLLVSERTARAFAETLLIRPIESPTHA